MRRWSDVGATFLRRWCDVGATLLGRWCGVFAMFLCDVSAMFKIQWDVFGLFLGCVFAMFLRCSKFSGMLLGCFCAGFGMFLRYWRDVGATCLRRVCDVGATLVRCCLRRWCDVGATCLRRWCDVFVTLVRRWCGVCAMFLRCSKFSGLCFGCVWNVFAMSKIHWDFCWDVVGMFWGLVPIADILASMRHLCKTAHMAANNGCRGPQLESPAHGSYSATVAVAAVPSGLRLAASC